MQIFLKSHPVVFGAEHLIQTMQLDHIRTWIFDLDNTLYRADVSFFADIGEKMTNFISRYLAMQPEAARLLQEEYYHDYGATLSGMMDIHGMDPAEFQQLRQNPRPAPLCRPGGARRTARQPPAPPPIIRVSDDPAVAVAVAVVAPGEPFASSPGSSTSVVQTWGG